MVTLSQVKEFFQKAWLFLKKYWAIFFVVIAGVVFLVISRDRQKVIETLFKQTKEINDEHKKQLEKVQQEYQQEREKRDRIEKTYQETLSRIEKEKQDALVDLDKSKKKELKEIIENFQDDPDKMSERINRLFNIPISK
jgi:DNA anti-recombination protein RmuC